MANPGVVTRFPNSIFVALFSLLDTAMQGFAMQGFARFQTAANLKCSQ